MDPKEEVLNTMRTAGKPLKTGELSEMTGFDKKTIDKVMKLLKDEELIVSPKGCFWEPKA
jgi:DNA-binding IscR family transcriptional regulator